MNRSLFVVPAFAIPAFVVASALLVPALKGNTAQSAHAAPTTAATKKVAAPSLTGTWAIDPAHSTIGFAVRHVVINDVHGTFDDFEGTIKANAQDITKSSVSFKAKVASINTRVPARDGHLKSPDFFDAAKYPELTFQSTKIVKTKDGFRAIGTLTMHGTPRTIIIPFTLHGPVVDGFGYTRVGVSGNLSLNRQDYGVKWNQTLDNGGLAVDNVVHVNLDLEAIKDGSGPKKS